MRTPVYWAKCDCHVWPLVPGYVVGWCGECGVRPHTHCDEPTSGRAERI